MFDHKDAQLEGPSYWEDLNMDVKEECEKFGTIEGFKIARTSIKNTIFIKFATQEQAGVCISKLNGRLFAGKTVLAMHSHHLDMVNAI